MRHHHPPQHQRKPPFPCGVVGGGWCGGVVGGGWVVGKLEDVPVTGGNQAADRMVTIVPGDQD